MPLDPYFQSAPEPSPRREITVPESEAKLLGRLDRRAGDFKCPFPKDSRDAEEWRAGFEAEEESWGPTISERRRA